MRQAGFSSSVDRLRMREMSVFKRTFWGKSPARSHSRETLAAMPTDHPAKFQQLKNNELWKIRTKQKSDLLRLPQ